MIISVENVLLKTKILSTVISIFYLLLMFQFAASGSATDFRVSLEGDTLSLTAEKVPLQVILLELASDGIGIKIDPLIDPLITADFKNRPVEQALESILKPASFSLLWKALPSLTDSPSIQLAEIQVFQSGRKELMRELLPRKNEKIVKTGEGIFYVRDEIILQLPEGTDIERLKSIIRAYNATLVENVSLPGFVKILLPENSDVFAIAREIKSKLNLDLVQPNYAYPLEPPAVYGIASQQQVVDAGLFAPTDNSVPIAILDSGLAANAALDKFVVSSFDVINPNGPLTDTLGHGTQMAFIASGIVRPYGAHSDESYIPIIPIRAFDDNGFTTDAKIMDSIQFALQNNARVMSLSWGSETKSDVMENVFEYAKTKGLVIVASAGNEPTGKPVYPAAYPSVIGVGALGPHGKTWEKSNWGNFVTLYAPGFANMPVGHKGDPGLYAGTSISAALVANTIASFLSENPAATQQEIRDYLDNKY